MQPRQMILPQQLQKMVSAPLNGKGIMQIGHSSLDGRVQLSNGSSVRPLFPLTRICPRAKAALRQLRRRQHPDLTVSSNSAACPRTLQPRSSSVATSSKKAFSVALVEYQSTTPFSRRDSLRHFMRNSHNLRHLLP